MDIKIEVDMDSFTWGDLEDMESQSPTKIRKVIQRCAKVDGVKPADMGDFLRNLSLTEMQKVSEAFQEAVKQMSNPVGQNGKNLTGGLPNTSELELAGRQ
jgi:hypothetical protein